MMPRNASRFALLAALLLVYPCSAAAQGDSPQKPSGAASARIFPPDAAANRAIENMYVPTKAGEPFSAKSVATLTRTLSDGRVIEFGFFSLLARDSSGKLYFENRRNFPPEGSEPKPRTYFTIIDPGEHTRTMCYPATKTCRISGFKHVSYSDGEDGEEAPPASSSESASLGTSVMESLTVTGSRETTTIAAGAYGNEQPIVITRDVWHSPELDLNISMTKSDPRSGTQTRKITEILRAEPDSQYFAIPADYKFLDDRPHPKQ
jgi:hypothetical protein